jgi:hypothetical protein
MNEVIVEGGMVHIRETSSLTPVRTVDPPSGDVHALIADTSEDGVTVHWSDGTTSVHSLRTGEAVLPE